MNSIRRAVLDVGTNSIKVLVADVFQGQATPVLELSRQTRLGDGLYESHLLHPARIAETVAVARDFAGRAREHGSRELRVIATSATREAHNRDELLDALRLAVRTEPEVISGEREAELAFQGVCSDPRYREAPLLVADVGGGSTQILAGRASHILYRQSFQLGAVRLWQGFPHSDPPLPQEHAKCREFLKNNFSHEAVPELRPHVLPLNGDPGNPLLLVGTGGTAAVLAGMEARLDHFDREVIESTPLSLARVTVWEERLWSMSFAERQQVPGLPPNRADIALYGVSVWRALMAQLGFNQLRVSTRGLRFGAILAKT